jgi:formylglycine-generating enzyme required for sulfatase activity
VIDWCSVPEGPFTMGSDVAAAYPPDEDETPRRIVTLEPYRIARTPVTNAQYARFVEETGQGWPPPGPGDLPVTYVTWDDAAAFCAWAGGRLPTEEEWEHAARGPDDRLWPWGDEPPDASRAVFAAGIGTQRPVGSVPAGASPFGVLDLAGNVAEWTDGRYDDGPARAVRGGAFVDGADAIRCSARRPLLGAARDHYIGFRPVAAPGAGRADLDWVEIPGGEAPVGRDAVGYRGDALADELPRHVVDVAGFELSRTPVTNAQYAEFVAESRAEAPADWADTRPPADRRDHPVTWVDWHDADAFCRWAGGRLPTEAEWEKAARGTDGRIYPWGDEPDERRAVVGRGIKHGSPAPVGARAEAASPYGLLDMAGNVWEWTASWYGPYPGPPADGSERVLRGGSYASPGLRWARCASRSRSHPSRRQAHIGFRVARGGGGSDAGSG